VVQCAHSPACITAQPSPIRGLRRCSCFSCCCCCLLLYPAPSCFPRSFNSLLHYTRTTLQASTSISLRATAGLRLLPGGQADALLAAVRKLLARYPFIMSGEDAVSIMDGAHEGAFAWLTLNYLLGRLGGGPEATVAAIDLGGGSVQEAFALTPAAATAAPPGYVTRLHAGGTAYDVYVHRHVSACVLTSCAPL
jgi:apyrase